MSETEPTKSEILELAAKCSDHPDLLPALVARCRLLSPLQYEQLRHEIAAAACISRVAVLDESVSAQRRDEAQSAAGLPVIQPAAHPVQPAELLDGLSDFFGRFIFARREILDTAALHVVFGHAIDAFSIAPRLFITSPERECGKTLFVEIIASMSQRCLIASAVTDAVLPRLVERFRPTVVLDEIDTYRLREREGLAGILNSGQRRRSAYAWKTTGENHEPKRFSTWAGYVFAGIAGKMPDTVLSRCIVLPLGRKPRDVQLERFGKIHEQQAEALGARLARYAADYAGRLADIDERDEWAELPALGSHRSLDNWRPLLAIAETAGPEWIERARRAARLLSGSQPEPEALGPMLLADLWSLFYSTDGPGSALRGADEVPRAMFSQEIAERLVGDQAFAERPWADYRGGKPLGVSGLATLLKPYGVASRNVLIRGVQAKGYLLEQLTGVFDQYGAAPNVPSSPAVQVPENKRAEPDGCLEPDGTAPSSRPPALDGRTASTRPAKRRRPAPAADSGSANATGLLFAMASGGKSRRASEA